MNRKWNFLYQGGKASFSRADFSLYFFSSSWVT